MSGRPLLPLALAVLGLLFHASVARAQIDPEKRQLVQIGYNQPLEGRGPIAGYGFFYWNQPDFPRTNVTLRLAIAPIYLDSEIGFRSLLSPNTDLAFGLAGGGFADSYSEVRQGKYLRSESFDGHGGEATVSLYHLVNPQDRIPLNVIIRAGMHGSVYDRDSKTARGFELPDDRTAVNVRAGARFGGVEPIIFPSLGMELSVWYEGTFRLNDGSYGYNGDRQVNDHGHKFWMRAALAYTLPELKHNFNISMTAGTSMDLDRFSAYRLGGNLPLIAEFPLSLPGFYFQEISAQRFVLFGGDYSVPLDAAKRFDLTFYGSTAAVDYLPGLSQPGTWNSGVGGGLTYKSPSGAWKAALSYSYGFDAIRDHGRGASSIGLICQFDLEAQKRIKALWFQYNADPNKSRGFDRLFGL